MIAAALTVIAGSAVVLQCICALNHMDLKTRNSVRAAYLTLLLCAMSETLSPFYDGQASTSNALLLLAVAGYIGVNQRKTYMVQGR